MKISIKYKLFFAILSAHMLVYLAMYSLAKGQFDRGFLDYVNQIEERQVPALLANLSHYYEKKGTWEGLRGNFRQWGLFLRESIESSVEVNPQNQIPADSILARRTPGRFSPNDWYYSSEYTLARPYLLLLNAQEDIILGDPDALPLAELRPILSKGQTVGFLAITGQQVLSEQADILFAEQQKQSFLLTAVILVFMSAFIAFPISTRLVRPIQEVVEGTRALTNGNYESQLKVRGSDELSQLSHNFNILSKTLDKNRNARRQWIADISHELRTPVAILRGELEALQDGVRPLTSEALSSLHNEVVHLNILVDDLHKLSLSDIGALVYEKEKLSLSDSLSKALGSYSQLIKQHKISLNTEIDTSGEIVILGDDSRLAQLFANLIQNTCRYTDIGGGLIVTLQKVDNTAVIEWIDSSPGVSDKDLSLLFDRFYRVESSRNRETGGSGLGLAICKNIIEAHEANVVAEHSNLGGLKLTITFPLA